MRISSITRVFTSASGVFLLSTMAFALPEVELKSLTPPTTITAAPNNAPQLNPDQTQKLWEMYQHIQQLEQEVRQLQGRLEGQESLLDKTRTDAKARYTDLDQRIAQRDTENNAITPTSTTATTSPTTTLTAAEPVIAVPSTEQKTVAPVITPAITAVHETIKTSNGANPTIQAALQPITTATPNTANTTVTAPSATVTSNPISTAVADVDIYNGDDKRAYVAAYEAYKAGGASKAIEPMKSFISKYPRSPFFANANYWLGEFYLAINPPNFAEAKQKFAVVMNNFPKSQKASSAIYRLATLAEVDDHMTEATKLMTRLTTDYPTSKEATYAQAFLKPNASLTKTPTTKEAPTTREASSNIATASKTVTTKVDKPLPSKASITIEKPSNTAPKMPNTIKKTDDKTSTVLKESKKVLEKENKKEVLEKSTAITTNKSSSKTKENDKLDKALKQSKTKSNDDTLDKESSTHKTSKQTKKAESNTKLDTPKKSDKQASTSLDNKDKAKDSLKEKSSKKAKNSEEKQPDERSKRESKKDGSEKSKR